MFYDGASNIFRDGFRVFFVPRGFGGDTRSAIIPVYNRKRPPFFCDPERKLGVSFARTVELISRDFGVELTRRAFRGGGRGVRPLLLGSKFIFLMPARTSVLRHARVANPYARPSLGRPHFRTPICFS